MNSSIYLWKKKWSCILMILPKPCDCPQVLMWRRKLLTTGGIISGFTVIPWRNTCLSGLLFPLLSSKPNIFPFITQIFCPQHLVMSKELLNYLKAMWPELFMSQIMKMRIPWSSDLDYVWILYVRIKRCHCTKSYSC